MSVKELIAPKPFIELNGKDVARYLYGDAVRILGQNKQGLTAEELRTIHRQVYQQGNGATLFGVRLSVITDPRIIKNGDKILLVDEQGQKTLYLVKEVKAAVGHKWSTVYTKILQPGYSAGFEGMFSAGDVVIPNRDYDLYLQGIYFLYTEIDGYERRKREPTFLERVMELANQFSVLVECWAIAHAPEDMFKDSWSHDTYLYFWGEEFRKKHGRRYEQVTVAQVLSDVAYSASLVGINRIYNDRQRDWLNRPVVDKITPLMEQMQSDILERLLEDDTLFGRIFHESASDYWKRRLQVIVELFNAPRGLVVSEIKSESSNQQSFRIRQDLDLKKRRQLASIVAIIERHDTEPGLKECALAVYQRILGRPYEPNDNR